MLRFLSTPCKRNRLLVFRFPCITIYTTAWGTVYLLVPDTRRGMPQFELSAYIKGAPGISKQSYICSVCTAAWVTAYLLRARHTEWDISIRVGRLYIICRRTFCFVFREERYLLCVFTLSSKLRQLVRRSTNVTKPWEAKSLLPVSLFKRMYLCLSNTSTILVIMPRKGTIEPN